jgi:Fic family protein
MEWASEHLDKLPFLSLLIRETYRILFQGVRGEKKQPGEFRINQNRIGGATINDAVFIPPVHSSVPELIETI